MCKQGKAHTRMRAHTHMYQGNKSIEEKNFNNRIKIDGSD